MDLSQSGVRHGADSLSPVYIRHGIDAVSPVYVTEPTMLVRLTYVTELTLSVRFTYVFLPFSFLLPQNESFIEKGAISIILLLKRTN